MREVRESDAEREFGALLKEVERGETIAISRDGKVIARVVPAPHSASSGHRSPERQAEIERAIATIQSIRNRGAPVTAAEIRAWIDEGRL